MGSHPHHHFSLSVCPICGLLADHRIPHRHDAHYFTNQNRKSCNLSRVPEQANHVCFHLNLSALFQLRK